jgi:hypothetical protein
VCGVRTGALGGLAFTARTYRLTEQGHLTDRYTKVVEQLGNNNVDVRVGAIYALERLAKHSKRDHPTIVEVLCTYVRERTDPTRIEKPTVVDVLTLFLKGDQEAQDTQPNGDSTTGGKLAADIRLALRVLGRLPMRTGVSRGDLSEAHISGAELNGAKLPGAILESVDPSKTHGLDQAQLDEAQGNAGTILPSGLRRPTS